MVLSDFINKGEVELVGERDYRIPFKIIFGGRMGHYDNQLGDMGRGSSPRTLLPRRGRAHPGQPGGGPEAAL